MFYFPPIILGFVTFVCLSILTLSIRYRIKKGRNSTFAWIFFFIIIAGSSYWQFNNSKIAMAVIRNQIYNSKYAEIIQTEYAGLLPKNEEILRDIRIRSYSASREEDKQIEIFVNYMLITGVVAIISMLFLIGTKPEIKQKHS